jgi:hypothetical protein
VKVEKRICDLCRAETKGKFAKLSAPKKWAKGEYEEDAPAPVESGDLAMLSFSRMFGAIAESPDTHLDICRHCFKALFGAAAWLRELIETKQKEHAQ